MPRHLARFRLFYPRPATRRARRTAPPRFHLAIVQHFESAEELLNVGMLLVQPPTAAKPHIHPRSHQVTANDEVTLRLRDLKDDLLAGMFAQLDRRPAEL